MNALRIPSKEDTRVEEVPLSDPSAAELGNVASTEIPVSRGPMVSKDLQHRATFRFNDEMDATVTLDAEPTFDSIITREFLASQAVEAFDKARDAEGSGVVLISLSIEE